MTVVTATNPQEAIRLGELNYLSPAPCKNGHISLRGAKNRTCNECARIKAIARREYDIKYRPGYAARKLQLRRERWGETLKRARERRKRNREQWAKQILPGLRYRAKKTGMDFFITAADIPLPDICPVLGIPLSLVACRTGNFQPPDNSPSVDRIDNTKGYIPGNVAVISWRANKLKNDASLAEVSAIVRYMEENI